jgi:DNA-binding CsgD family transcriptional regulator/tetratricopeptide (TPR) repeat protein
VSVFRRLFGRRQAPALLRVKNGDTFAACGEKYGVTAREDEIIRLLLEGKGNREITEALFISDHTVKNHIHNIYRKLGIKNRVQLVQRYRAALEDAGRPPSGPANGAGSPGRARSGLRRAAFPGALLLIALAVILVAWRPWVRKPGAAVRPPMPALAVLDFENLSGDTELDKWVTGLPLLLTTDLLQSKNIRTLGDDTVFGALKKHGLAERTRYSREELRRLARELKADYLLTGSMMKAGGSIVVTAFLQDARTGAPVRTEKIECPDEQGLIREADRLARLIRSGLSLTAEAAQGDVDLDVEVLTTSSALAYKYYSEGRRYHRTGDYEQSLLMLKKAVELDAEFAMAYRLMSVDARNLGYYRQEAEFMRTAFDLSTRLPEGSRERHLIRGDYYGLSEPTYGLAVEAYKQALANHPDDVVSSNNLAMLYYDLEDYEAAVRQADTPIRQGADHPFLYHTQAVALAALGRADEAVRLLESYHESRPANRLIFQTLAETRIMAHDHAGAAAALDRAEAVFPDPSWAYWRGAVLFHTRGADAARAEFRKLFLLEDAPYRLNAYDRLGNVALAGGRFVEAAEAFRGGAELAETNGQLEWAAYMRRLRGQVLFDSGDVGGALVEARKAVEAIRKTGGAYRLATALLFEAQVHLARGDAAAVEELAGQSRSLAGPGAPRKLVREKDFFEGVVALEAGRASEAGGLIEKVVSQVVRKDGQDSRVILYHLMLAAAREKAGDLAGAAEALKRIVESPGDTLYFEGMLAKAVLGLARLEDKLGRAERAREGYRAFLDLWKEADPGRPEVEEARARLAALSGPSRAGR